MAAAAEKSKYEPPKAAAPPAPPPAPPKAEPVEDKTPRALMAIVGALDGERHTFERGDAVPEDQLKDLVEGKHFMRGPITPKPRGGVVKMIDGRDGRRALIPIDGAHPEKSSARHTFEIGDVVPVDQLKGLREGVHYE